MRKTMFVIAILLFAIFPKINAATIDSIDVYSIVMHKSLKCIVVLPVNYSRQKTYPVVYLLNGYGGGYRDWLKAPNVEKCADMFNMIVVFTDGGYGSWYFNSPIDSASKYETFVAREVPNYIDAHYSTIRGRGHRAIAGLSMGGHGALYIAIKHKDIFGACSSMSGAVDFTPFSGNWDIAKVLGDYEHHKELWEQNTVNYLVGFLKDKDLAISFECGTDDFFIGVNRALHTKLLSLKISHDYAERPGEHNWNYWNNAILHQMLFFNTYFSAN